MLIQVDVDSTLYDSDKLFAQIAKEEFGLVWPRKYYKWFGPDEIGTDLATLKNLFKKSHSREYVLKNKPYPGAVETLARVADEVPGVEIAYVSDRNEQQTSALREWLQQEGFLHNDDQHVAATADKREWMKERRPEIVIDDRVRTILFARYELGSQVVSLEHGHNSNLVNEAVHPEKGGIFIVPTWDEIEEVLFEKIIPLVQQSSLAEPLGV